MITNVYVDGFNLYYGCLKGSPHKWLDLETLCGHLLPAHQIKYLLVDAFRQDAEAFVVISNDSDLKEPIRIVCHELNYTMGLINSHPPAKRSRALENCKPTFFKQIRQGVLAASQFPSDLNDAAGAFHKPADW